MSETHLTSRRTLIKGAAAGGLALMVPATGALGANDDIRLAIIGLGGKGNGHARKFAGTEGVRLVAVCDVDPKRINSLMKDRLKNYKHKVATETDPRRIIERDDVDVVVIATPDHWHALLTVWACQAGKDVYVEKPVSHNIREGALMAQAAKRYNRVVQAGTQYRSCPGLQEAAEYIHAGKLGKVLWGHVPWYELRGSIGKTAPYTPTGLDYDVYCGPAEVKPLRRDQLHYDWHWIWSTGTGDLGNSGIHAFDVCRWFSGHEALPPSAMCVGGRFGVDDAGESPNTQITILNYETAPIIIENRNLPSRKGVKAMDNVRGVREGVILQCENGYFAGFRAGGWAYDNDGNKIRQFKGDGGRVHHLNFLETVRSRRTGKLNAPIHQGHISSACCHLGNVSYQLGEPSTAKEIKNAIGDDPQAAGILELIHKHLDANEVDVRKTPLVLGPRMTLNTKTGAPGSIDGPGTLERAKALYRGSYRAPYTMPEIG